MMRIRLPHPVRCTIFSRWGKDLLSIMLLCPFISPGFAGNFYAGGSGFLQVISAQDSNYFGIHPQLSLGYRGFSGRYTLSGEIFAVPAAGVIATSISNFGVNTKTTYSVGASFIPGMPWGENKTAFLRLGVACTRFPGANTWGTGAQLGLGILKPLAAQWDMRLEYVYTAYPHMAGLGSPVSNEVALGIIYQFEPSTAESSGINYKDAE